MQPVNKLPVIILDRDGVINEDSLNYIKSVDEFIFLPGSINAIAALSKAGFRIGVATNQSGVSRGYYNESTLKAIHQKMLDHINAAGGHIHEIVYCIHKPDEGCACRKPNPGMLLDLATRFRCEASDLVFIGDKMTDLEAAIAAGAKSMLVISQMTDKRALETAQQDLIFNSLEKCAEYLLASSSEKN